MEQEQQQLALEGMELPQQQDEPKQEVKEEKEEEEEMPLLFSDGLPRNFQQSSQLAALATFMADSEDEDGEREVEEKKDEQRVGKKASNSRAKRNERRRRGPYARPDGREKAETKELQLFMNMFKM